MTDETPIIDCWEPGEPNLKEIQDYVCEEIADAFKMAGTHGLEKWFKRELSNALRALIVEEGDIEVSFGDDDKPRLQFWAGLAQYDELTYSAPLAGKIEEMINSWGDDIDNESCGLRLRRRLRGLRAALLAAVDKIDTTLLPYHEHDPPLPK